MPSLSVLALLVLCPISSVFASGIKPAPLKPTAVAERNLFSSVVDTCSTVSGLASPQPSGAVCGELANSDGTGYIVSYTSGSPYVASLAACGQICLDTANCTNVYFTQGSHCNLHSTMTAIPNTASSYIYYSATCFTCTGLKTCSVVSGFATPQPANSKCGVLGTSDGSGYIISYTSGVYTEDAATCGEICLQTAGCTNVYFTVGEHCNLHSGLPTLELSSTSPYSFYNLSCFTCEAVIYTSSSSLLVSSTSLLSQSSSSLSSAAYTSAASSAASSAAASSAAQSAALSSTSTAPWTWTSVQTNPALYNMALTTTFTQSPQCTTRAITQMDYVGPYLWDNSVNPLPTSTVTTCYPPQFYSSVIGTINNVTLPAFSALVCPYQWDTIAYNASYIACCPNGFGLIAPNYLSNSDRPFSAALCTSNIGFGQVYDVSSYNSTAYWTLIPETATAGTVVFADAFDGLQAPATVSATTSTSLSIQTTSTPITSSSVSVKTTSIQSTSSSLSIQTTSTSISSSSVSVHATSIQITSSSPSATSSTSTSYSLSITTTSTAIPGESALPACGQLCFNNMLAQYSTLGCDALDAYCLCGNVNFGYGLTDCANGACGTAVASTVIAFGSAYCSTATATHIPNTSTIIPGESSLPACGQLCFNNMLAQYQVLGCNALDSYCLCSNVNFGYGIRDCSNGACGTAVASTVIAFGSAYCSSATATHTGALVTAAR